MRVAASSGRRQDLGEEESLLRYLPFGEREPVGWGVCFEREREGTGGFGRVKKQKLYL